MPTKIAKMEAELAKLKQCQKDGMRCSPIGTGNSLKFDIAWLEQAIEQEKYMAKKIRFDSQLGRRFMSRTFENFDVDREKEAYEVALKYCDDKAYENDEKNSLMILGRCGTGKTHLAAAITNRLVDEGVQVLFDTYSGFLEKLRKEIDTGEHKVLSNMKNISMLVLDDIGKEKQTEWTMQVMFDVINRRYEALLPTVLTTNLNPKELKAYLGEATYSRLCEMCTGVVTRGADKRQERK